MLWVHADLQMQEHPPFSLISPEIPMSSNDGLMRGNHWIEPLLPGEGRYPRSLLDAAERLPYLAGRLSTLLPAETTDRLGKLLRITDTYYTNLIEGQHTEPATLAENVKRKSPKELNRLAIEHMYAQAGFQAVISRMKGAIQWPTLFSPELVIRVHERLFKDVSEADRTLEDGSILVPGQMRSECGRAIRVGNHTAPAPDAVESMMSRMNQRYGQPQDVRTRLICAMAYHHRLAFVHPFAEGNGRVVRMVTHLQLHYLGMSAPLWSLSRGLARKQDEYYQRLAGADQRRRGNLDGRGQLSESGLCEFIEFMLDVCVEQMKYMEERLSLASLQNRVNGAILLSREFDAEDIKPGCARALLILLSQGKLSWADFIVHTGLGERVAFDQLKRLIHLKVVESHNPFLHPGLPFWYANTLFPDLHMRFRPA